MRTRPEITRKMILLGTVLLLSALGNKAQAQPEMNLTPYIPPNSDYTDFQFRITPQHVANATEVLDGCLPVGPSDVLRFAFFSRNDGFATVVAGSHPAVPPAGCEPTGPVVETEPCAPVDPVACAANNTDPTWVWTTSHCHWHRRDFGRYSLFNASNKTNVATGGKFSFAITSSARFRPDAPLDADGDITAGWQDTYKAGYPCQFVRLPPGLSPGPYNLVAEVNNAGGLPDDARMFDNAVSLRVNISVSSSSAAVLTPVWDPSRALITSTTNGKGVSVVSRQPNQYDLFYIGTNGHLYLRHQEQGSWSSAFEIVNSAGEYSLVGAPSASSRRGYVEVFARGADGRVYRFYNDGSAALTNLSTWSYYYIANASASSSPASQGSDFFRRMVVWLAPNGTVQFQSNSGTVWTNVAAIAGLTFPLDQTPALAASGSKAFQLFLRNASGQVVHNRYIQGAGWTGWTNLGGSVVGSVAATSAYLNRIDVFARGSNNQLIHKAWEGSVNDPGAVAAFSTTWVNEAAISDVYSDPTAIATGPHAFDVIYHARSTPTAPPTYKRLHFQRYLPDFIDDFSVGPIPPYQVEGVEQIGGLIAASTSVPITAASWADGVLDLFLLQSSNGAVYAHSRR